MGNQTAIDRLRQRFELEIDDFQRFTPINAAFEPTLRSFLRKWEDNFAPYIELTFDYRFDGKNLDIHASMGRQPRFIIDMTVRRMGVRPRNRK